MSARSFMQRRANHMLTVSILVLAADITPMDIISHLPIVAEDESIPYVFITSKEELGRHCSSRRPTSCVLVSLNPLHRKKKGTGDSKKEDEEDLQEIYSECFKEIGELVSLFQSGYQNFAQFLHVLLPLPRTNTLSISVFSATGDMYIIVLLSIIQQLNRLHLSL